VEKGTCLGGAPEETSGDAEKNVGSGSEQGSAKKRSHDEMVGVNMPRADLDASSKAEVPMKSKEPLERTSSFVRLAMTVDGAVKVSRNKDDTPSPEKPRPVPADGQTKAKTPMMRSKSAIGVEVFRDSLGTPGARMVGAGYGRSRDARTWEFYCDSKTKDALSTQAEAETSGSAVSAINLIRSNSFKSRSHALSPSSTKTNSLAKSSKGVKAGLSRTKSSLGRLQGLGVSVDNNEDKPKRPPGHVRSPSDDSDKENWAPGTRLSEHGLRRTQPSNRDRPILQENEEMTFPNASSSRKGRIEGHGTNVSPTKDMDCIQGLLSLSQGAWTEK
jgi:hypothetical protein